MSGINLVVYFIPTVLHTNVGMSKNMAHVIGGLHVPLLVFVDLARSLLTNIIALTSQHYVVLLSLYPSRINTVDAAH